MPSIYHWSVVLVPLLSFGCGGDESTATGGSGGQTVGSTGGAGGEAPTTQLEARVSEYGLRFDIDTGELRSSLTLDVQKAGGCYAVSSALSPTSVTLDGAPPLSESVASGSLSACGPGWDLGAHVLQSEVVVPQGQFFGLDVGYGKKPHGAGTFTYLLSWIGGCDRFGPCDDKPSELTHFTYEITHPSGTVALCPGHLVAGDTVTHCDLLGTTAPTYSAFAVMADTEWKRTPFANAAGVGVVFYEAPGGALASSLDPTSFGDFLSWATALLGPFPYGDELRFAGAPTKWLGFEHPANVVLDDGLPSLTGPYLDSTMHVAMHETIHQWAGDRSTIATEQDFAWKEAIAEYLAYVFEDEHRPLGEAVATRAYWDGASLGAKYHVRPNDQPAPAVEKFYGDVYGQGPMLLFVQLEPLIGRAAVLTAIASFLHDPGARSVAELRTSLEASSGKDLGPYFDAWVFGVAAPSWPTFTVSHTEAGGMVNLTVTQSSTKGTLYPVVVEVELDGPTTSSIVQVDFGLAPTSATVTLAVPFAEAVTGIKVDPAHRVVDLPMGLLPLVPPLVVIL